MKEPPELDGDVLAVLEAARGGHEPSELNRARVRKGVELKLAAGIALAVGPASSALAGALKLTAAVVAVGSVVATGIYVLPREAAPRPESTAAPARAPAPQLLAPLPAQEAPPPRAPKRRSVSRAPAAVESATTLTTLKTLKEETALLSAANAALGRGEAERALSVLKEYDRLAGAPMLAQERAVTGILASCAAGQTDEARSEARRFRARWPRSPLAARVDASCAATPTPR